jgi:hypothetical protein
MFVTAALTYGNINANDMQNVNPARKDGNNQFGTLKASLTEIAQNGNNVKNGELAIGEAPKYRARRSAVSPVIPRRSATIACTRVTGTPMSFANRYAVIPSGFMNSSRVVRRGGSVASRAC